MQLSMKQTKIFLASWSVMVGLLILTGWVTDSYILKRIIDSPIPMNPVVAIAFIIIGIVTIIDRQPKVLAPIFASVIVVGMALKFIDIFCGTSFDIDSYIFTDKLLNEPAFPNRIAPNAAFCLLAISSAVIIFRGLSSKWAALGQLLLLMAATVSLFAMVGHLFKIKSFYGVGLFTPMAIITAITAFVVSCALLIEKPHDGFLRFIFNNGPAGQMAKFLIPASLGIPLLWGWLRLWGQRKGYFDPEFGVALSVVVNSITLFAITCISGHLLYRTDKKRSIIEEQMNFLASHDPLTGLNTRRIFMEQLTRRINLAQRREQDRYAIFYLDVDGLKKVNDQLGHQAGDELLLIVTKVLKDCTRASDTIARIGGDEFVILFEEILNDSEELLAKRILEKMPNMFNSDRGNVPVGISIGIAIPYKSQTNAEAIVKAADEALYEAKRSGKGRYVLAVTS